MAKRVIIDSDSDEDVSLLWYKKPRINNSSLKIDSTSSDEENTQPTKKVSKEPFGYCYSIK